MSITRLAAGLIAIAVLCSGAGPLSVRPAHRGTILGDPRSRLTLLPPGSEGMGQALLNADPGQMPPAVDSSYRPSDAERQKLAQIMGDAAARDGAEQGTQMRQLVLSGEAVREYEKIAPALGLRPNDAVDALAFYLLAQWGVANDYRPMFTPAQVAGVRRQAANAYASVAAQVTTDALRQEFGEMLVVQGMIMAGVHENAVKRGDQATIARAVALAREGGTKLFTVDPTTIDLTDNGFHQR